MAIGLSECDAVNATELLIGGLVEHEWIMTFPSYWEWKIIPTVTHSIIFQRGRLKPPTRLAFFDGDERSVHGQLACPILWRDVMTPVAATGICHLKFAVARLTAAWPENGGMGPHVFSTKMNGFICFDSLMYKNYIYIHYNIYD